MQDDVTLDQLKSALHDLNRLGKEAGDIRSLAENPHRQIDVSHQKKVAAFAEDVRKTLPIIINGCRKHLK